MPRAALVMTLLCMALSWTASPAGARTPRYGVAVLPFSGEGSQGLEQGVLRLLMERLDLRVIAPERWRAEMRRHPPHKGAIEPDDFVAGARDLNLRAALCGQVVSFAGDRLLMVDVLDPMGAVLSELAFPLPETGPIPEEVVTTLAQSLPRAVDQAIGKRPPPPALLIASLPISNRDTHFSAGLPEQAGDTEDPFATGPVPVVPRKPPPPTAAPRQVFRFAVGPALEAHRLTFSDPQRPGLSQALSPALLFAVQLQPIPCGPLSGLYAAGTIGVSYWQDLHGTDGSSFPRNESRYEAGLGYRFALPRDGALSPQLSYGSHSLSIGNRRSFPAGVDPLPPDVDYRYVSVGAEGLVPLWLGVHGPRRQELFLQLSLGYRGLLSAGPISQQDQYGPLTAKSAGFHAGAGLVYNGPLFFLGLSAQVAGYLLSFDPSAPGAKHADSATDLYIYGLLLGGFHL